MINFNHLYILAQQFDTKPLPNVAADSGQIQSILNVVFAITGAIAVLMVVIGGIKFAGSRGDPQGVAKAKETVIYAIIGLLVTIFAVVIVDFVFGKVTG